MNTTHIFALCDWIIASGSVFKGAFIVSFLGHSQADRTPAVPHYILRQHYHKFSSYSFVQFPLKKEVSEFNVHGTVHR
jgi:hypothetical protein